MGESKQENNKVDEKINEFKKIMASKIQSTLAEKSAALLPSNVSNDQNEDQSKLGQAGKLKSNEILKLFRDHYQDIS
jgi:hypothetical protein